MMEAIKKVGVKNTVLNRWVVLWRGGIMSLDEVMAQMDQLMADPSVPKNIRKALEEAKRTLMGKEELSVKISSAVYLLQPHVEDPNLPMHARLLLLNILSGLESVKQ